MKPRHDPQAPRMPYARRALSPFNLQAAARARWGRVRVSRVVVVVVDRPGIRGLCMAAQHPRGRITARARLTVRRTWRSRAMAKSPQGWPASHRTRRCSTTVAGTRAGAGAIFRMLLRPRRRQVKRCGRRCGSRAVDAPAPDVSAYARDQRPEASARFRAIRGSRASDGVHAGRHRRRRRHAHIAHERL